MRVQLQIYAGVERRSLKEEPVDYGSSKSNAMPKFYWAEAVRMAVYIQNRISTTKEKMLAHELYISGKSQT